MANLRLVTAVLTSVLALTASAQSYQRVLLPVVIPGEVPGAFGSRWTTTLAITNNHETPAEVLGYDWAPDGCVILCPPQPKTPPSVTFFPGVPLPNPLTPAALLLVESSAVENVQFQLRVQDVSRQGQTWGTELPVVQESHFRADVIHLLDVPLTIGFRPMLRIYGIDALEGASVRLRVYGLRSAVVTPISLDGPPPEEDPLLSERIIHLAAQRDPVDARFDFTYAHVGDLQTQTELAATDRVRIEIAPLTPGLRTWAFVSVTNDATQHVTTITP